MITGVREEINNILTVAHDKFLYNVDQRNLATMKECMSQGQRYTIHHQVEALGCISEEWRGWVGKWIADLKKAVKSTEEERGVTRASGNPLVSILDDFEFYEPAPTVVQSPIIEKIMVEKGIEEEEEEEQLKIRRRGKGKMIVEESEEEEELERQGGLAQFDDFFNVTIIPDMEIELLANESVHVEQNADEAIRGGQEGEPVQLEREGEEAPIKQEEMAEGGDGEEELPRSPEFGASNLVSGEWYN